MAEQEENSRTAKKIVKGLKQRLGHFTEMLKFLDDLRGQELVQAEPEGVWDDLEGE